jgi:hypothetical protein
VPRGGGKLPKLTRGIKGPPIRKTPLPLAGPTPNGAMEGCVRFIISGTPNRQPVFYDSEHAPSTATATIVDDDIWQDIRPQAQAYRIPQVFTDNDESWPLGGFRLDEDYWSTNFCKLPNFAQPFTQEDDAAPLGGFRLDEDDQRHSQLLQIIQNIQPTIFDDDVNFTVAPSVVLDEDQWERPYQQTLPTSRLVYTDNDESWPLGGFRLDEDYWQPTSFKPTVFQQPSADTDVFFLIATPFGLEDDDWNIYAPQNRFKIPYNFQPPCAPEEDAFGTGIPPIPTPSVDEVFGGWKKRKPWPLPPPHFPIEVLPEVPEPKQAPSFDWLDIEKKPATGGRGLVYRPQPVEVIKPKTFKRVRPDSTVIDTSAADAIQARRRREEEEVIISLLMRDEL